MKKKIKDLTYLEKKKFCKNQQRCYGCILSSIKVDIIVCCADDDEREVEVDE